ncbi:nucleoside hydrolase-like domain-containing protein [Niabella aurantiaca]|uniref:nucleoside hydrolase-like domain-containing protein n=1 Tax=Niabella aurantiaca TaxID=379900 RepID=UPI00036C1E3A|nr:nucleoside hydrolase-like domain-containing protein [Niabella aurantiaca]
MILLFLNYFNSGGVKVFLSLIVIMLSLNVYGQQPVPYKPRVLISSDIGGTDPDDNQSMAHLFMYSDRFDLEGLVSSPSFGEGSKEEIYLAKLTDPSESGVETNLVAKKCKNS